MILFRLCAVAALFLSSLIRGAVAGPFHSEQQKQEYFFHLMDIGQKLTVVVYGTSLTAGGEWAGAMKDWFEKKSPGKVTFINSGGPGQNSDWGVANLKAKVLSHYPDLVLIEFSFNDAHDKFKMPMEKGLANLDKMVRAIQSKSENVCVVLQIMNAPWDAPNDKGSLSHRPQLEAFNDNYRRYAKEHNLTLVDHYPAWSKLKESDPKKYQAWVPDGTHPNKEGSLAVTWAAIKEWLENGDWKKAAGKP